MLQNALLLLASAAVSSAATVTYNWNIGWVTAAPDGTSRPVIGINGAWPNPTIEATAGDQVIINVVNQLGNESTSLHFHGISQTGTSFMDGPAGVTQCGIPPGASFQYNFIVDAPGAYWYHSHSMGQYPDGLRGPLIVQDPADPYAGQYSEEYVLTTSDWYHSQSPGLINTMLSSSNPQALPPFPDNIILNEGNAADFAFVPGTTYKFTIINFAAFASVFFEFDSHTMTIIAIDGSYVVAQNATQIRVTPAQRYTVLVTAKADATTNYAILAALDENRDFSAGGGVFPYNATGQLQYDSSASNGAAPVVDTFEPYDDSTLVAYDQQATLGTPDQTITLDFQFGLDSLGIPRAYFNGITYVDQKVPSLYTAVTTGVNNTNPVVYGDVNPFILEKGQIIDIVLNNLDGAIHPFHLHGHQFQVLTRPGSNSGSFSSATFPAVPPKRDTIAVFANSHTVLRFEANNPGVQLFHCHIEWHVEMGLTVTLIEGPEELRGITIPADHLDACDTQCIPTSGNAAGNVGTDLTGAYTLPPNPDNGAVYNNTLCSSGGSTTNSTTGSQSGSGSGSSSGSGSGSSTSTTTTPVPTTTGTSGSGSGNLTRRTRRMDRQRMKRRFFSGEEPLHSLQV